MYDSREDTLKHIWTVRRFLKVVAEELDKRAKYHDCSKFDASEKPYFDAYTPKLKGSTYGSEEYKGFLSDMQPALEHHYANNRHHPEYFTPGVLLFNFVNESFGMNLIDIIEMFCDWKAATMRHDDGDLKKSILINQKRFGFSEELTAIFLNTVELFEEKV